MKIIDDHPGVTADWNEGITSPLMKKPGKAYYKVSGVRVDAVQQTEVVSIMEKWIHLTDKQRFIAVTGMHGISISQHCSEFREILNSADLVVPDGFPLVMLARYHGFSLKSRVCGPELMATFFRASQGKGYRHFFYGGNIGVAELLAEKMQSRFPGFQIAGIYSPHFRKLSEPEKDEIAGIINDAKPDLLWVGLSTPKQERWMHEFRERLNVPVMVGVGAAFDFHAGKMRRAPLWMQEHGLEWFFRLLMEPRRLWRRYLIDGSSFLFNVSLELFGLKRFD